MNDITILEIPQFPIPGEPLPNAVFIPENIVVHLGAPDQAAENVSVPFIDYIKNVASSEVYPTWPENAIRANVHAIVSIALNRIFTRWYRSRGYDFDITNNINYDQAYVHNRGIFDNISAIVDEIFNEYISVSGRAEPLFASFCDGRISKCEGMYQWGSVDLANQGYSPIEILKYYYRDDIVLLKAIFGTSAYNYKGTPIKLGDSGLDVLRKQVQLNRIARNFPAIPMIQNVIGFYDAQTEASVREFQRVFDLPVTGIIDEATFYKIFTIYSAVTKIAELEGEGVLLSELESFLSNYLLKGDVRPRVVVLQYFLNFLSSYYISIPLVNISGTFDEETRLAVIQFQNLFGLNPTGIVDPQTWNVLFSTVFNLIKNLPPESIYLPYIVYPGINFTFGDATLGVFLAQLMLSFISQRLDAIPPVQINGIFDEATLNAVLEFQNIMQLQETGIIDEDTWNELASTYRELRYEVI